MSALRSFDAFRAQAAPDRLVPVWRDGLLDVDTPVSAFTKLRRGPVAFRLESAPAGSEAWSRCTVVGTEPRGAWRFEDGAVSHWTPAAGWGSATPVADPFASLRAERRRHEPVDAPAPGARWGGAMGVFGSDVVRHIERLPHAPPRAMQLVASREPERRGPNAGAVGYLAMGDGRTDLAITIRTCVLGGGEASVAPGAGTVHDSVPAAEWLETAGAAGALLPAIGRVRARREPGR